MSAQHNKPDESILNGIGRDLRAAFAPDSPIDPELKKLIRKVDGTYAPDEAADRRVDHLIERLNNLWSDNP